MLVTTHLGINKGLCGTPSQISEGKAVVDLVTTDVMASDDRGLVHGGFIFGLADYAAMLAVNDPNVVLGAAETRFLKPVVVGDFVEARAIITGEKGKKREVMVDVFCKDEAVFSGTFTCFVLENHVLES